MRARALIARPAPASTRAPAAGPTPARPEVRQILHASRRPQAKLTVGAPDDAFEKEADQVADQVMRMPEPAVQRMCAACEEEAEGPGVVQRMCSECEEEKEQARISRKESEPGRTPSVPQGFESRFAALQGGGQPLPASERTFFEPRFGHDFSDVRLHSGPTASELASSVQARAFTLGNSIVLGAGETGRELLAHELTHVVQQGGGREAPEPAAGTLQRDDAPEKKEETLPAEGMNTCDISAVTTECAKADTSCKSVTSYCASSFPTTKDMDALEKQYRDYVTSQTGTYPNAAANLEHFLDHSGKTRTLPASLFSSNASVQGVLEHHRDKFIAGAERRLKGTTPAPTAAVTYTLHFTSPGNAFGIPYTDLGLAVGGYQLCSTANVTATPAGSSWYFWKKFKITFADWKAQAFDCYNWDPGKSVPFVGNDKELCCLQNDGRGKHFFVKSDSWANTHAPSLAEGEVSI